ncbi:MAG: MarC family protein [Halobacteriovoraceae bacterium]|nr:MarC family protein [Halobacteriovoraceae bacterium]
MNELFKEFLLAFTPLFIAIDAIALVPIYLSLVNDFELKQQKKMANIATMTATILGIVVLFAGKKLFSVLGITEDDLRIGGGILLFLVALSDLLMGQQTEKRRTCDQDLAIVPVGIPLILGPAALTTVILMSDQFGYTMTLAAYIVNMFLVWIIFYNSQRLVKIIGRGGTLAIGKVASLFLLAIAVMMVRIGIANIIRNTGLF